MSKEEIRNYLKANLELATRSDLFGKDHLCLLLEGKVINSIKIPYAE